MKLSFFLILIVCITGICEVLGSDGPSRLDYRYEAFARSNPIGSYVRAEAGYSIPIWGKYDAKKPFYGFVRPMARFQSSGLINTAMAGVEFNPISFFSFYAQKSFMRRDLKKLDNVDCEQAITCRSNNIQRDIWGFRFAIKLGGFFLMNRMQWHTTQIKDRQNLGFVDEQGTLIGSGSKDQLFQAIQVGGYDFNNKHGVGFLHKRNLMKNSREDSTMIVGLYKYTKLKEGVPDWTVLAGPGVFKTRQGTRHPMLFGLLQYSPQKGWTLF